MKKIICVFLFMMLFCFNLNVVRALTRDEELLNAIKNDDIYKALISENNACEVVINDDKLIYTYNVNNESYTTTFMLTNEDITLINSSETMNGKIVDGFFVSSVIRSVVSLNGNTKEEIDKLVDKLLEKDDVKKLYKKYREMLEKEKEMFDNRYFSKEESKEQNKSIENKEKELHDRIANMILQNIKCYREDVEEYE